MDKRLSKFAYREIKPPFKDDKKQAEAFRELFSSDLGSKVLDSLILDMDYHKPDFPGGVDVTAQLGFNAGKRYVINHILSAITSQFEAVEEEYLPEDENGD